MLIDLHPNYIEKKGKKEFVVLPIEEYNKVEETLNDYEDIIELRKTKEIDKNKKSKTLNQVKQELDL
jgi:PHD/YefM family antitoxin component YafN of YafNO toxin-antitoxin module